MDRHARERDREKDALLAQLDRQRRHVLGSLEGLTDEQLRRPVLPSGWHCLGMVKHLTLADERFWFRFIVADEPGADPDDECADRGDWRVGPDEDVVAAYRDEIARSNAIIERTPLDTPPARAHPIMRHPDLRSVILHMIGETATHAGHLDAARELLDGRQWVVVDDGEPPAPPDAIRLTSTAVNCPDARALAAFYADITDGAVTFADDTWATVKGPGGRLDFQTVADHTPPAWPGPVGLHLDFLVDDLVAGEARVLAAGATRFDFQPNAEHSLVYADPVGHPFCLTLWDDIPTDDADNSDAG
jgi:hypothetical protein